jgi:hypothetical protein
MTKITLAYQLTMNPRKISAVPIFGVHHIEHPTLEIAGNRPVKETGELKLNDIMGTPY